jgi:hypothetical protein
MKTYKVKKEGLFHKGSDDATSRPYSVGETISLKETDAKILAEFLAGESEAIDMGELVPKAKLETMEANLKDMYETKMRKITADKNALTEAKDKEIVALKEKCDGLESALSDARKELSSKSNVDSGELDALKKELATTKGLLTKANKKILELEK